MRFSALRSALDRHTCEDAWHERLVRYYSYFGFTPVCKVSEGARRRHWRPGPDSCKRGTARALTHTCCWSAPFGTKQVGGRGFFQDVPHLLVWGGEGTRMDADVDAALRRWTPALRKSIVPKQQPAAAAAATGDS
jgi:hypothetical protein